MSATAYVVEDHAIVREMVTAHVNGVPGVRVCGSAASAEAALGEIETLRPDVVLIDLSLPGMSGLELVRRIRERIEGVACLVVSGHAEPMYRTQARAAGCHGFVLKDEPDELAAAVRAVLAGAAYEPPSG
ncbi:MAG TPA: response regulator transcription factor [Sandaracinaceae bacterium LLY-WYZ-13_1]|nr:response regulator transcription factor [Sandaracinaceae bacterium LLY-WYZ-13_1]